jgi:hypothetical protein
MTKINYKYLIFAITTAWLASLVIALVGMA